MEPFLIPDPSYPEPTPLLPEVEAAAKGKSRASRNACKGGIRPQLRELRQILRDQEQLLRSLQ